jgi:hypothetical protein
MDILLNFEHPFAMKVVDLVVKVDHVDKLYPIQSQSESTMSLHMNQNTSFHVPLVLTAPSFIIGDPFKRVAL